VEIHFIYYCSHSDFRIPNSTFPMPFSFTTAELEAWLDEALPAAEMAAIEQAVRSDPALLRQLAQLNARRDAGVHTLGGLWRKHRLSCPTREKLALWLKQELDTAWEAYIRFHLETVGCRFCSANLADLERQQAHSSSDATQRRSKFFRTSAGHLKRGK
jgi:hypothetical protein